MFTLRFVEKKLERLPLARRLSIWSADRRLAAWRRRNPGRPFSDYYVDHVRWQLDRGKPHPTLGAKGFDHEVGRQVDWDRTNFASRGGKAWREYLAAGIEPGMRIVDYGCGSLRVGQHAIRFADRGNYWGLDVVETFIEDGRKLIAPELIDNKRPRLSAITDRLIDLVAVWEPHFIFSHTVIQHVPEDELHAYFERLARMMGPGCKAVIEFIAAPTTTRLKAMSWAYSPSRLRDAALAVDPNWSIAFEDVSDCTSRVMKKPRQAMIIERTVAEVALSVAA